MIFICGPTSSGKTSLAIKLCKKYNGEIISADSRQIYRDMDIGTGKLPVTDKYRVERNEGFWIIDGVKIWMYDVVSPGEYYSVTDYKKQAEECILNIKSQGKMVFVVGGTGLYIDALLGRLDDSSKVIPDFGLREELSNLSVKELQEQIPQDILEKMNNSDINNPRRLIRKIEKSKHKVDTSGKQKQVLSEIQNTNIIILGGSRETLYDRVDMWVDEIWDRLKIETRELVNKGYEETPQIQGLIYKTTLAYINDEKQEVDVIQRIKFDLHAYIRRQETWFKKYKYAKNIDIVSENFDTKCERLVELINNE